MRFFKLASILAFTLTVGCGDGGPPLAVVEGRVTVDDQPVSGVNLTFVPENGSPSYGQTDKDGKYTLMYSDTKRGAMLGQHKVTIEATKVSKEELAELKAQGIEVPNSSVDIPKALQKPGVHSVEVKKGKNVIDFPLTSK